MKRLTPASITPLLLASGLCALVYQVAWFRALRLVFGTSTASNAAVLAIFMGGLGAGALLLGPIADRRRDPLRLYAFLELAIAALAALSPLMIAFARVAYHATGGGMVLGGFAGTLLKLFLATLVLGLPTFLMGGTLPAAVRAVQSDTDAARRGMGMLYGANALGAVAGAALATFFLLELLGIRMLLISAAVVNALVALLALAIAARRTSGSPDETAPARARPRALTMRVPAPALAAAAGVGFAFFLMELVWYRMLTPILGGSSYTFGLILALALFGIGLGGILFTFRRPDRPATMTLFAGTCIGEAFLLLLPLAVTDGAAWLAHALADLDALGFPGRILGWTLVAVPVIVPGAIVAGYQFPVLVSLAGKGRPHVGREVGEVYAWNTLGAIAGALAGGFGLLPWLSAPGAWRLAVGVLLVIGLAALLSTGRPGIRRGLLPWSLAAAATVLLFAPGPTVVWRHAGIGARRAPTTFETPNHRRDWERRLNHSILWEEDGRESSVALLSRGGYHFVLNGKVDGNARYDAPSFIMTGMLGAMLHPDPKTAFVVGLGTGASAGWLGAIPEMQRVDVVEMEPAIVEVARACAVANKAVLDNPKVNLILGDAREVLPTTPEMYDVVVSQPSNPYRAGVSSLYTREFYQSVQDRLNPGGLFVQWFQAYEVGPETIQIIYATIGSVFPHVESWEGGENDILLVASREPRTHDVAMLRRKVARAPYREALLRSWGVEGVEGLLAGFVANDEFSRALGEAAIESLSTDDNARVEYGFARRVGLQRGALELVHLRVAASDRRQHRPRLAGSVEWMDVIEAGMARALANDMPIGDVTNATDAVRNRVLARRAWAKGDLPAALQHWLDQPDPPRNLADRTLLAEAMAAAGHPATLDAIAAIREDQPVAALACEARYYAALGHISPAISKIEEALRAYRQDPWPPDRMMGRALRLADYLSGRNPEARRALFHILEEPFALNLMADERLDLLLKVGLADDGLCAEALAHVEPYTPWREDVLEQRVRCYERTGHPNLGMARADLEEFVASDDSDLIEDAAPTAQESGMAGRGSRRGGGS